MVAGAARADRWSRLGEDLLGVATPGTLLLFLASSVLSLSLIFQADPENTAVLSAHGWGYGPLFWQGELWRLIASQFLHTRFWHFACNAYWFLIFGPALEEILGTRRYLASMFAAAWIIGLAGNLTWEEGGIGLSGLIYFQFGCLSILARGEPAAAKVCDGATRVLMWGSLLLLGPLLTWTGAVRVGNVVHLSGCLLGLLAGALHRHGGTARRLSATLLTGAVLASSFYLYAPVLNPEWHFWKAYNSREETGRIEHYRRALELDPGNARILYNLGLALFERGDDVRAEKLWLRCVALDPGDTTVCRALISLYARRGDAAGMERWSARLRSFSL